MYFIYPKDYPSKNVGKMWKGMWSIMNYIIQFLWSRSDPAICRFDQKLDQAGNFLAQLPPTGTIYKTNFRLGDSTIKNIFMISAKRRSFHWCWGFVGKEFSYFLWSLLHRRKHVVWLSIMWSQWWLSTWIKIMLCSSANKRDSMLRSFFWIQIQLKFWKKISLVTVIITHFSSLTMVTIEIAP